MNKKDLLLKKLLYRSTYRGCKETDVLLGKFFQKKYQDFEDKNLEIYQQFIEEDDALIYDWLMSKIDAPEIYQDLVKEIQQFHDFKK